MSSIPRSRTSKGHIWDNTFIHFLLWSVDYFPYNRVLYFSKSRNSYHDILRGRISETTSVETVFIRRNIEFYITFFPNELFLYQRFKHFNILQTLFPFKHLREGLYGKTFV